MSRLTYHNAILASILLLLLAGCQPAQTIDLLNRLDERAVAVDTADLATDLTEDQTEPLTPEAQPPRLFEIAELGLTLEIETMGWVVTEASGQPTTEWIVPTDAIGWHANSAGTGGAGNVILSGHQAIGSAVFAPLALGELTVGQEIALTDSNGATFLYQITEVSEPIPILGATDEDNSLARSYMQPSETPILTLMTGWPDFTTTHRIFAVADFVVQE